MKAMPLNGMILLALQEASLITQLTQEDKSYRKSLAASSMWKTNGLIFNSEYHY